MDKFFFISLIFFLISCGDKTANFEDGDAMSLSHEEKVRIISENGYSEDISKAENIAIFLEDEDKDIIGQACFYLGYLGARNYIEEVNRYLQTDDNDLLNMCVSGLALMVDDRDDYLLDRFYQLLKHEFLLVRMGAIEAIGNIKNKRSSKALMDHFDNDVLAAKYEIVKALGKIGNDEALPLLRSYLQSIKEMDHSVPRKGGTRGSNPHPDVIELAVKESIALLEEIQ